MSLLKGNVDRRPVHVQSKGPRDCQRGAIETHATLESVESLLRNSPPLSRTSGTTRIRSEDDDYDSMSSFRKRRRIHQHRYEDGDDESIIEKVYGLDRLRSDISANSEMNSLNQSVRQKASKSGFKPIQSSKNVNAETFNAGKLSSPGKYHSPRDNEKMSIKEIITTTKSHSNREFPLLSKNCKSVFSRSSDAGVVLLPRAADSSLTASDSPSATALNTRSVSQVSSRPRRPNRPTSSSSFNPPRI